MARLVALPLFGMRLIFSGTVIASEDFALVIHFQSTHSVQSWTLVNIYGLCKGDPRITYTNWLFGLYIPLSEDWLLVGDFNYIQSPKNRNKSGGSYNDMITFNDFTCTQCLVELTIKGRSFTWSNMQTGPLL